jgi:hypothetical protein
MRSCAQAVEDKYSLWKAQEKKKEMPHQEIRRASLNVSAE